MRRGTRVGQAYVAVTADGDGINEEIVNSVDEAGPGVEKAGDEHGRRYGERFSRGFRDRLDTMRDKVAARLSTQMGDAGDDSGREFTRQFEDHFDGDFLDRLGSRVGHGMVQSLMSSLSKEDGENPLSKLFDRWMSDAVSGNGGSRSGGGKGGMGDLVGRMFGAGSRNNFLNLFGKTLGNIVNLLGKGASVGGKMFSTFSTGFSSMAQNASFMQKVMGGFSSMGSAAGGGFAKAFSSIAKFGPAAAAAIAAVVFALTAMVSVVGALIGLVTALAASITAALVGSLLVLGGALSAVVAAGGLLTAAFMSMTDAQKKLLTDAFQPLKAEMVGIGQIMLQDMVPAFSTWSANLQAALMQAVPVAQVMGQAFAEAGNRLTASFSGPGFQMFSQALATYLPSIVTRLASALGSFLNGLLGLFAALMPQVNRFAGYLADVAERFSAWATSAQGQTAISDFVNRSVTSLQALWNFVSSFGSFLVELLFSPQAMNAGNTIFDGLARTFDGFTQKVQQAAANGDLQRWFDDAVRFGSALWGVMESLGGTFMTLYNSGVINGIANGLEGLTGVILALNYGLGPMIQTLGWALPNSMRVAMMPLQATAAAIIAIGESIKWVLNLVGMAQQADFGKALAPFQTGGGGGSLSAGASGEARGDAAANGSRSTRTPPRITMPQLQLSGNNALNATSVDNGGYRSKKYRNPYTAWANSLIKQGPSVSAQIKNAMLALNKAATEGIRAAARETGGDDAVWAAMDSMVNSLKTGGESVVNTARSALNSAASSLASASSKGAAKSALRKVRAAQRDLRAALADQRALNASANMLAKQKIVRGWNITQLLNGVIRSNTTLAEFAQARFLVADRLEKANQKLADAISLRDDYKNQVSDSIKAFGALASAQASSIDGVEQALTAGDITSNLQSRLDKIKKFQIDLQLLLAQGLSNDAYKQIVDEGVEGGTALADALLAGGSGTIQNTNSLVSQINGIANTLGTQTSNRMYQAGVDAAQGLVNGLTSLSAQLDAAAYKLGNSIALAVKRSLGIASPSKVLDLLMDPVGDGAVNGLNRQHVKVGSAAAALAGLIAVNPGGGGSRPTTSSEDAVSGNGQKFRDLIVQTPTEDPKAVAHEVLNEVVGRL